MKKLLTCALVLAFYSGFAQNYFEGEIIYRSEYIKKDPNFDLSNITAYPAKIITFYFKNGNWKQSPDSAIIEYEYFNHDLNMNFYKILNVDTLLFEHYDERSPTLDSILSINQLYNTDTILNKVCNRLILQTASMKLTFIYSPYIKINPAWFSKTKGDYYDILYKHMKSLYLKFILETEQFVSKQIAVKIIPKTIPDSIFPDVKNLPKKKL